MRVALYARYSAGPRQTDQSIEGQIRVCTDFCKQKGFQIVETYADKHISGKTDARPEFQRLIADSSKNKFEGVVVYKTDRFARNKYDSAVYKRELRRNGIQIYYAAEAIPDGPEGIILESLMEGLAEYYSAELAQKIKRGMHESATKCRVLGNCCPLGYRTSAEHTYEIDPDQAKAVMLIFEMYIDQKPNAEICRKLNAQGFKTSRGNPFNKNSISRIIQNEMYIGIYDAAGVRIEGGVPAIVEPDTFYLAQQERKRRKGSKKEHLDFADYLLSGKLFCGHCKKAMVGVSGTGKSGRRFYYYYCQTMRAKKGCDKKPVRKDDIEDLVVEKTVKYILQPEIIEAIAKKLYDLQAEEDTQDEDIKLLEKRLAENKKASDNIIKAVERGLATDTLLNRLETLEAEKIALEGELAVHKSMPKGLTQDELEFFLYQYLTDKTDWENYKRRIILDFVREVYLYDDHLTVFYRLADKEDYISLNTENADEKSAHEVFDQCALKWTYKIASRTPSATVYVIRAGIILICKL